MHFRKPADVREEFGAHPRRALIITTVVHESRAVKAHLIETEHLAGEKNALYEYGRFSDPAGDWLIVHAITPQGNSDAGLVASKAHEEFGAFTAQLFVGVAGSLKTDIEIGSVVVGDYVHNSHSAKIEDSEILARPHGLPAAVELQTAAQALIYTGEWTDLIKSPVGTVLPTKENYPCPFPPEAFIKGIVSGEEVVAGGKSQRYVDLRTAFNDSGAVEMEGWGAMNAARYQNTTSIVIRGISDMCAGKDHAKDKLHQPIASAHAAAFAFSLLSFRSKAMPPDAAIGMLATPEANPESNPEAPIIEEPRVEYVVNLKGSKNELSDEQIRSFVDRLKALTGDPDLTLVRVDSGSVRVVVNVRERDLPNLDIASLRTATSETGAALLGATTADQLGDAEAAKSALRKASANLLAWDKTLPGGGWIERPERAVIESRFDLETSSTVLLGEPGSGKSALLSKLAADLIEAGTTVFALKADFISTDVRNEAGLKDDLELPGLPSDLILSLARLQPVFVLIDQLDALASQLDLQSDRLNVLLNFVRRIGDTPNVHIVLSARTFEFNHDVRLRAVQAEGVSLRLPPWHKVKEKLAEANIDAETWPEKARDVVRIPQALKTYLILAKTGASEPFTTYQSMLEQLWRERIASAQDGEGLAALASDLAGRMAEEEALWLAAARFDSRLTLLQRLEALGFVVRSENGLSVAFSHQTVFDYVLARTFVRTSGLLSTYVLERQDSLFVRPKLWSALNYLREAEVGSYEREFLAIWRTTDLRRHLRLLLIEFLGQVAQPLNFEIICLEEVMRSPDLRLIGLKAITNSPSWLANFARTAIPEAMLGGEAEAGQAMRILIGGWRSNPDEVVRLVSDHWLPLKEKDSHSWVVLQDCPNWNEDVEGLATTILARSPISIWSIDHTAATIAVNQPDVALRLVATKLDFLLEEAKKGVPSVPYPEGGTLDEITAWHIQHSRTKAFDAVLEAMEWNGLPAIAEAHPAAFLHVLWPWYIHLFAEMIARRSENEDSYIYPGQYVLELELGAERRSPSPREMPVKDSIRLAVEGLAEADAAAFAAWADANENVEILAAQQLVARGLEVAGDALASKSLEWLLHDERRFQLGTRYGLRSSTVDLIHVASPRWSSDELLRFEAAVFNYKPSPPAHLKSAGQRKTFADIIRATKKELFGAVDPERLSAPARELVLTEQRALGDRFDRTIGGFGGGFIGSPMEAGEMAKAKDRDILKIFREIPDSTNWDHPTSWMRGGNIQLSRAFAEFSRSDPDRGVRIMEQFEPTQQERAAGYALDAMADVAENDPLLMATILDLDARGFGTAEFRDSTARAIEKIANRKAEIADDVVELLVKWLEINAADQATDGASDGDDEGEASVVETLKDGSLLWGMGGATSLPQGNFTILSALASILLNLNEAGRDRLFGILDKHFEHESNPSIWKAFLHRLTNAGGSTPEIVSQFLRKLFGRFPQILATREGIIFLAYAQRWDDQLVFDLIVDWPKSDRAFLHQAFGELVGLVATVKGTDQWVQARDGILTGGSEEMKIGLAYAAVNTWNDPGLQQDSAAVLTEIIPGASSRLTAAAMDVFRVCEDLVPDIATISVLKALTETDADFSEAPSHFVVERLQELLPHAAELVSAIAFKLIESWRSELGDIRTGTVMAAPQLTDLALTLHRLGGPSRQTGIAIFEAMIEIDAYGARDTLAEVDGRFSLHQATVRQRLARRTTNRSRRRAA